MARYIDLDKLIVKARAIDPPHNFQHERRDIVEYIYASWNHLLKAFYNDDAEAVGFRIIDTVKREKTYLKPCPICGGAANMRFGLSKDGLTSEKCYIQCEDCGLRTEDFIANLFSSGYLDMIEAWNDRAIPDA